MRYLGRVSALALLLASAGVLQAAAPWDHADAKIRGETVMGPNANNNVVYYSAPMAAPVAAPAVVQAAPAVPATPAPAANGLAQTDRRGYRSYSVQPNQAGATRYSYSRRSMDANPMFRADSKVQFRGL